jgi:ubiquinone/menaquinone biosynthesis C-methylase UbiE
VAPTHGQRRIIGFPLKESISQAISGLNALDMGCGEGSNARKLARLGVLDARHRHCARFLSGTRKPQKRADPLGIGFHVADGTALPFADTAFDFMTAFMSLMDVPDQARVLQEVQRVLRPTGLLQFSIVHPCFVPALRKALRDANGNVRGIGIGGYFDTIDGPESRYRANQLLG